MSDPKLHVPKIFRRGSLQNDEKASVQSGIDLLELISSFKSIKNQKILDFGCGVKLAQALMETRNPQKLYTGLDVYDAMIKYLQQELGGNKKYEFATVDFKNDMYNKEGRTMTGNSDLPIRKRKYDIITMFSVITHMNPKDTLATLRILRRYAKKDAMLLFSTFLPKDQKEDFLDGVPDRPLLQAKYRKDFLEGIVEESGWKIVSYNRPIKSVIQHHYVCSPN